LERLIGKASWDKFIPHYFTTWLKKSLDSYDFKATLLDFFKSDKEVSKALESVDWDSWFYKPGLPPKPKFDTNMVDICYALAKNWESKVCYSFYNREIVVDLCYRTSLQTPKTSKAGPRTK
jgi:leukotriene-A4 hydrolase